MAKVLIASKNSAVANRDHEAIWEANDAAYHTYRRQGSCRGGWTSYKVGLRPVVL
jgi:hypothetical protein